MRGICRAAACGVILLSSPLADAVTSSTGMLALASGLAARNAATRAAISLSSSGLLTARLFPPEACGIIGHFCRCRTGDHEKIAVAGVGPARLMPNPALNTFTDRTEPLACCGKPPLPQHGGQQRVNAASNQ